VQPGLEFAVGKSTDRGHKKVRALAQDQFAKRLQGPMARAFHHHIRLGPEQRINAVEQPNLWRRCRRRFRQHTHDVKRGFADEMLDDKTADGAISNDGDFQSVPHLQDGHARLSHVLTT